MDQITRERMEQKQADLVDLEHAVASPFIFIWQVLKIISSSSASRRKPGLRGVEDLYDLKRGTEQCVGELTIMGGILDDHRFAFGEQSADRIPARSLGGKVQVSVQNDNERRSYRW